MRLSFLPVALLFCALVFIPGCSEEGPIQQLPIDSLDTNDTTINPIDTLGPCKSAHNPLVGASGFVLDGPGFANVIFAFDTLKSSASIENVFGPNGTILSLSGRIGLTTGDSADVRMEISYPTIDQANKYYDWQPNDEANPSGVRLVIERNGAGTVVLKPDVGSTRVVTVKIGSFPYRGEFCGFLKDSVSGARVGVKSGRYYIN